MEGLSKKILFIGITLVIAGCGVKGRPSPPKTPPPLGRGEPVYKETQKKKTNSQGTSYAGEEGLE